MTNPLFCISGLPRSGSTLLSTILGQNPKFLTGISNPLAQMMLGVINARNGAAGFNAECSDEQLRKILLGLIENYYHQQQIDKTPINTNRSWLSMLSLLHTLNTKSKVIVTVRDIGSILNSFEALFQRNVFQTSVFYGNYPRNTVYDRTQALCKTDSVVGASLNHLHEGMANPLFSKMCLIVEYEHLCRHPREVLNEVYDFLEVPNFRHNFDEVESKHDEFDVLVGCKDLHTTRSKVTWKDPVIYLPNDLIKQYSGLEFWRL